MFNIVHSLQYTYKEKKEYTINKKVIWTENMEVTPGRAISICICIVET